MRIGKCLYPVVDVDVWASRYNITLKPIKCLKCGIDVELTKPFAVGTWRGVTSVEHGCGEDNQPFVAAKSTKEERQEWIDYAHSLGGQ